MGAVAAVMVLAAPAVAIGTSGVDLTPQLPRHDDGSYVLAVEDAGPGTEPVLVLTNVTGEPRDARVYAASADVRDGDVSIGAAGSVPWLPLDETFTVAADGTVDVPVVVLPRRAEFDAGDQFVALVLEVSPSSSLVTQAVSVVRVERGPVAPLPSWPLVVAIVLLASAATALGIFGRGRTEPERAPVAAGDRS